MAQIYENKASEINEHFVVTVFIGFSMAFIYDVVSYVGIFRPFDTFQVISGAVS